MMSEKTFMATIARPTSFRTVYHVEGYTLDRRQHCDVKLFEGYDAPSRLEIETYNAYGAPQGDVIVSHDVIGLRRCFAALTRPVTGVYYTFSRQLIDAIPPGERRIVNPRNMEFHPEDPRTLH